MFALRRPAPSREGRGGGAGLRRTLAGRGADHFRQGRLRPLGDGLGANLGLFRGLDHVRRGRRPRRRPAPGPGGHPDATPLVPGGGPVRGPRGEGPAPKDDGARLRSRHRGQGAQHLQPGVYGYPRRGTRGRSGHPLRRPAPVLCGRGSLRARPQEESGGGGLHPGADPRGARAPPKGSARPARRITLSRRRSGRVKRLEIVQIGLGHVGRKVAQIVLEEGKRWREQDGLEINYRAVFDTSGALLGEELLPQAIRLKEAGGKLSTLGVEPLEEVLISEPAPGTTRVVVDVAVHGGTYDLDLLGVQNGSYLVLSNKGPLSGSTQQYER